MIPIAIVRIHAVAVTVEGTMEDTTVIMRGITDIMKGATDITVLTFITIIATITTIIIDATGITVEVTVLIFITTIVTITTIIVDATGITVEVEAVTATKGVATAAGCHRVGAENMVRIPMVGTGRDTDTTVLKVCWAADVH